MNMSKTEILDELPRLTPQERQEIRLRLADLDHEEWLDDGELTAEEKALIETRVNASEHGSALFIPWEQAKATIAAGVKK